jgi:hypothetical protein
MKAGHFRCWHFSDIAILANVRFAPLNETARAVGRCGVGRGRANNLER